MKINDYISISQYAEIKGITPQAVYKKLNSSLNNEFTENVIEYNGKKYECVFGYGVDSSEKLWNEGTFQKDYNYTDTEIEFISKWFEGDK